MEELYNKSKKPFMKKKFNVLNWYRKNQFDFFNNYEDPFFNVSANLEVTNLYRYCKENGLSISLANLYFTLESANSIEEFKLRIIDKEVYLYNKIHIGSTVLNEDNTFSFCYFNFENSLLEFDKKGHQVLENHKKNKKFAPREEEFDLIHCSTLPWISFTGFKHARNGNEGQIGIPKIVFGKMFDEGKLKKIPISVEVHHALMDGFHVAQFLNIFQEKINQLK